MHKEAEEDETILRVCLDAKATVWMGLFSRRGKTRVVVRAADHDFKPDKKLTPFGIFLPQYGALYLYFTSCCVTSDFIADCFQDFWMTVRDQFDHVQTLLLNLDNGQKTTAAALNS